MPTDRLFKYTISGTMFFLVLIFWYLIFGGTHEAISKVMGGDKSLLPFVGLFFSTPVLGLILSTVTFSFLYTFYRRKVHYYVPDDQIIIDHIISEFPEVRSNVPQKAPSKWPINKIDYFYPYYQTQVRHFIKGETLQYLERRWAAYWTHCNTLASILISFVIIVIYISPNWTLLSLDVSRYKIASLIAMVIYARISWNQAGKARRDGCNFEHIVLRNEIKKQARVEV